MAAMWMAGVTAVYFAYSNDDAEPFGLSTAAIAADLARPFIDQSMQIRHCRAEDETGPDIYIQWARQAGGS
ncbi:hypothetical protein FHR22_003697 [Sphingopyxis panaciterrae]|nr:hypothetical protein [Sphingopyxis panaciterrae]